MDQLSKLHGALNDLVLNSFRNILFPRNVLSFFRNHFVPSMYYFVPVESSRSLELLSSNCLKIILFSLKSLSKSPPFTLTIIYKKMNYFLLPSGPVQFPIYFLRPNFGKLTKKNSNIKFIFNISAPQQSKQQTTMSIIR